MGQWLKRKFEAVRSERSLGWATSFILAVALVLVFAGAVNLGPLDIYITMLRNAASQLKANQSPTPTLLASPTTALLSTATPLPPPTPVASPTPWPGAEFSKVEPFEPAAVKIQFRLLNVGSSCIYMWVETQSGKGVGFGYQDPEQWCPGMSTAYDTMVRVDCADSHEVNIVGVEGKVDAWLKDLLPSWGRKVVLDSRAGRRLTTRGLRVDVMDTNCSIRTSLPP